MRVFSTALNASQKRAAVRVHRAFTMGLGDFSPTSSAVAITGHCLPLAPKHILEAFFFIVPSIHFALKNNRSHFVHLKLSAFQIVPFSFLSDDFG